MKKSVRFMADPSKVRVSIQKYDGGWTATVTSRTDGTICTSSRHVPQAAVMEALHEANAIDMPGIDIYMEQVYDHPHFRDESHKPILRWDCRP